MASSLISLRLIPSPRPPLLSPLQDATFGFSLRSGDHRRRLLAPVRAGPPSSGVLILVFALPLSLLAGTIFASIRIADKLDEKFLEELAMNQSMMEEYEDAMENMDDDDDDDGVPVLPAPIGEEVLAAPRVRNRPKREA